MKKDPAAREDCVAVGDDQITGPDGATKTLRVPQDYFAADAVDPTCPKGIRFSQLKRTTQTMNEFLVRFDLLRRKAEARDQMGGFVARDIRLYLARAGCVFPYLENRQRWPARREIRRLFGPSGGAVRQGVSAATELDVNPKKREKRMM